MPSCGTRSILNFSNSINKLLFIAFVYGFTNEEKRLLLAMYRKFYNILRANVLSLGSRCIRELTKTETWLSVHSVTSDFVW